jgi:ubiquinone/menaquinone biosynthesis C-methylase UbiE
LPSLNPSYEKVALRQRRLGVAGKITPRIDRYADVDVNSCKVLSTWAQCLLATTDDEDGQTRKARTMTQATTHNSRAVFNAEQYKSTTRQQWEDYASGWNDWAPLLETWLGRATERMLDLAGIEPGNRVLDVAAGAGGQSIAAARRVGPDGSVLATDLSPTILQYAARAATLAELDNVSVRELDGEQLRRLPAQTFDAAISRVGLIYFPDRQQALTGIWHALREGGRFATVTYSTAATNGFFSLPVSIIRERAALPAPAPGQPGPFSLADPDVLRHDLTQAGFRDIAVEVMDAPVRLGSASECVRFERESFGALHQMLGTMDVGHQESVWAEIETAMTQFDTPDGFVGPCQLVIAGATR